MKKQCIKEETLMNYLEGRLSEKKRRKVESHLADCDNCLQVLTVTGKMIKDSSWSDLESVPDYVTRGALKAIKALKKGSIADRISEGLTRLTEKCSDVLSGSFFVSTPALATVRGSKTSINGDIIMFKKSFPDLDAEIEVEKKGDNKTNIRVSVTKDGMPLKSLRIALYRQDRELASYLDSAAFFEDTAFGPYVLRFTGFTERGAKINEIPFEIRDSAN